MNKLFFGFAVADSMFIQDSVTKATIIERVALNIDDVEYIINNDKRDFVPCVNPSHVPTIKALKERFPSIAKNVVVPERAPSIQLEVDDSLIVMSVRGLPRLEGRHEYTKGEIENADFSFSIYNVVGIRLRRI